MDQNVLFMFLFYFTTGNCGQHFSPLKDDIMYRINWLSAAQTSQSIESPMHEYSPDDSFIITSANNEQYSCTIPTKITADSLKNDDGMASETSPHKVLAPIFKNSICSYRYEPYWTYELCHGKQIRQYHEERVSTSGKSDKKNKIVLQTESGQKIVMDNTDDKGAHVKTTEYVLGKLNDKIDKDGVMIEPGEWPIPQNEIPTKVIDGVKTPYYPVEMKDGTPCDLKSGLNRHSTILYICKPDGHNEILSISEISSCVYELIVLSPNLCAVPQYNVEKKGVNDIQCVPVGDSPKKPKAFREIEESLEEPKPKASPTTVKSDVPVKNDLRRVDESVISPLVDKSLLNDFLAGTFCLTGGSGWWRYEFCYGKHVHQFHNDVKLGRTTVVVGKWNKDIHLLWAAEKSSKPKISQKDKNGKEVVTTVQHFYSNGDVCDKTGKPRQVVVRLKCKKDAASPHAVSLYLLEPTTCQYILGIESLIVCDLLDSADENGLLITT